MESRVGEWLADLIRICKTSSPSSDAVAQVDNTLKNVVGLFNDDAVAEDVEDLIYAALFDEELGIFKFIQEASRHKEVFDSIGVGFGLIMNLIEVNRRNNIKKYALYIEEFCWRFWMEKQPLSMTRSALKVLISLYNYRAFETDESQFTIRVNKLMDEISRGRKIPKRVLQQMFHLLGVLCNKYPGKVELQSKRILNLFLYRLKQQVKEKESGYQIVLIGCFEGLSSFLYRFPLNQEDTINQKLLNDVIKLMALDRICHTREAHRAAFKLLVFHGSQFSKEIMKDYVSWHYNLWYWVTSDNPDDNRAGKMALDKFYQVVSKELLNIEVDEGKAIYQKLVQKVRSQEDRNGLGVAGFGYLSAPAKVLFGMAEVSQLFSSVQCLIKKKFLRSEGSFPSSVRLLPIYMETMSMITSNLDHVTLDQVVALQEVAVHLIENYPNFPQMQKYQCAEAVISVAHHSITKGSLANMFLEKVLYQGLIRSCSFPLPMDVELLKEESKTTGFNAPIVTGCLNYVSFWQGLFGPRSQMIDDKGMDVFAYKNTQELLFDHFISSILVILDRLDLTLTKEDQDVMAGNTPVEKKMLRPRNEFGLASATPKDFVIFCNLVAIIYEVFPTIELHMMEKCLNQITMGIIDHSERLPLISGFYKVLESCLLICISSKYFEDIENETESMRHESYEKHKLFTKLKQFLQNMLLEMKHYKGDLKLSCLQVLLATPTSIIKNILPHLVSPMKSVFEIGSSYYKVADAGIGALEKWTMELPFANWEPVLKQILPSLNSFIKIGVRNVSESNVSLSMEKLSKASTSRRKYLVAKRRFESKGNQKGLTTRYQLQRKCLLFLGQLPPSTAQALLADENDSGHGMAWDTKYHLSFPIPLPDMHPCIDIDKFLPRIVDLSLKSSDRHTRIAACELLHAMIMYLLGKGVQLAPTNQDQLSKLVERLAPSLLQLGCYPDDTSKGLFHKLLFSLSHWYSRNWKSKESGIWISALMDGLCDPHNAAIRELSACCLKEYVERMLYYREGNKLPMDGIEKILENICNFSLHSNQYRRIGAAIALNNLCPILQEEASIVSQFWLELIYCQVVGMEVYDAEGSPSNLLISSPVHHLEKVLKSKARIFNEDSKKRQKPPGFQGVLLKDLIFWLLSKIGSIDATCRGECMRLFLSLAPCVDGYSGPKNFIGQMIEEQGADAIIDICEGESKLSNKTSWNSSIGTECKRKDLLLFLNWLNSLFTSLQCYIWIFENNLVQPSDIFLIGGSHKVFSAVSDFLFSLDNFDDSIFEALSEISFPSSNVLQEVVGEMCLKPTICGVSVQILKFLSCLHRDPLSNAYVQNLLGSLWTSSLWHLIKNLIFKETIRGNQKGVLETLQRPLKNLFEVIASLPATLRDSFFTVMNERLQKVPRNELEDIQAVITGDKLYMYMDFVSSVFFLQECSPKDKNFKWVYIKELEKCNMLHQVYDALFTSDSPEVMCVPLTQAKMKYLESLLKLSLCLNLEIENLITLITDDKKVETIFSQSNMTKGEHFLTCFKSCVMSYLFLDINSSLDSLLKHLALDKGEAASNAIMNIIKDLFSDKRMKQRHVDNSFISSCLTCHWDSLQQLTQMDKWTSKVLDLLLAIYVGVPDSTEIIRGNKDVTSWCVSVLTSRSYPLDTKAKALELLPCLLSNDDEGNLNIRTALRELCHQHLPSGETVPMGQGTINTDLEVIIQRLLIALEITSCPMLLDFIINASNGGSRHTNHEYLDRSLTSVLKRANADQQLKLIQAGYKAVMNDDCEECTRLGAVKNFMGKLIKISDRNTVENFYKIFINEIDQTLRGVWKRDIHLKIQLISKIVCFQLVEIMFVRLNKRLEEPSCLIVLDDKNGKPCQRLTIQQLLGRCIHARKSFKEDLQVGYQRDLFRRYRCAAYNAAIAIVANLKTETKCYKYLFQKEVGERMWEGLVDTSVTISLQRSFDKLPERVPVEAPICEGVESRKRRWDQSSQSSLCLTTQEFLADSTLNEDITKFDYQNCSVQSLCRTMRDPNDCGDEVMEDGEMSRPALEMHEKDPANDHECMTAVTSLIKHLVIEGIFPSDDNPEDFDWLNSLKEDIEYRESHNNVKIFLVRVIVNCEEELASHAKSLMLPLMKLVADGSLGNDINYLVTDVIQMLLAWYKKNSDILLHKDHVTGLFNYFALNAEEALEYIFKGYLDLIRSIYESWKDLIEIPYDAILEKFLIQSSQKLGIFLSRLFLEHSKVPWRLEDKKRFLDCLLRIFQNGENQVQLLSAYVIGQILRTMDPAEIGEDKWTSLAEDDKEFTSSVIKYIRRMLKHHPKEMFLKCIREIQLNYSSIVDEFNSSLLCLLPNLRGKSHTICMAIIYSRVEKLERPFLELNDKGLKRWLTTNIPEDQQIALKMVMKVLPKLQEMEILEILDSILAFHCHSSVECRKVMFEILIWIFDNFCLADWEQSPEYSDEEQEEVDQSWTDKCAKTLLYGLIDEDKSIQSQVCSFFEGKPGLKHSNSTPDRFVTILNKLYSPATEATFLGYAITLLLSPSSSTPNYNELLFEHPLDDCAFEDYQPRTSHRTLNLDMSPMFTESLASSLSQMELNSQMQVQNSSALSSQIRASQRSLVFSSTQGTFLSSDNPPNIATGSNVDSLDGGSAALGSYFIPREKAFKRPHEVKRMRYLSKPKDRSYYAAIENAKSTQRMENAEERIRKRDAEITLHRKFRVGDFPDIQIHCYDILKPLCSVAKRDSVIAQQLYVSLFIGIWKDAKGCRGDLILPLHSARDSFCRILKHTNQFSGPLISAILEISLSNVQWFPLNMNLFKKAVDPSPLACLCLEASLNEWLPKRHTRLYDRSKADKDKKTWLQLAMMYRGIEEYDVVHGIFHDMMGCGPGVKEALEFERSGQWTRGKTAFQVILNTQTPSDSDDEMEHKETDYYFEGYFKCLESLSQWDDLNKEVMRQLDNSFSEAWSDGAFWIPWLMKSEINRGLELESNAEGFFKYISGCLKDSDKGIYLQSNYGRELALIHSMFGQCDRARNLVRKHYDSFLEEWLHISPLSTKIKAPKLLNAQLTSELSLFLSAMKSYESHQFNKDFRRLCNIWKVNLPNYMEPLSHWEHRIACRHLFIRKMTAADVGGESLMDDESIDLGKISAKMTFSLVNAAILAKNFHVADKYLKKSEAVMKDHADSSLRLPWHISQAFLPVVKGLNNKSNRASQLKLYVEAWDALVNIFNDPQLSLSPDLHLSVVQKVHKVSKTVHRVIKLNPTDVDNFDCSIKMKILSLIGDSNTSTLSLAERISEYGINLLEKSFDIAKEISERCIADHYLELAKYCQYLMEDTPEKYEEMYMKAVLRAMAYESQQARQWFPCILQLNGLYSSLSDIFQTESSKVPTWMYLSWTSQILAHLNASSCSTLSDLVVRLAETYPSAIVYPFRISSAKYQQENSEAMRALTNRLEKILFKNKLLEKLLESLVYICVPVVMLNYHLKRIISLLESPKLIMEEVERASSLMMNEVFPQSTGKRTVGAQYYGNFLLELQQYEEEIRKAMHSLSSIKNKSQANALVEKLRKISGKLQMNKKENKAATKQLRNYSKWISEFRSSGRGEYVEMPGQYTGDCEPNVEESVKIVGFHQEVAVMFSLFKPIRLTFIGSDAKEYKFLIKYGEDLRLDQRIEQLFGIMNKILAVNPATKERKLYINTFQVIPLTNHLGIIEWVDNTLPLKEVMSLTMEKQEIQKRMDEMVKYDNWINKAGHRQYADAFLKYGRNETIQSFKERANTFPCDMLRRALLRLSLTFDSFWSLRNSFTSSYATMCIAHWLLGIGDRHKANTLVSLTTGKVIGIDFGYSFGTTTQFMSVPELMPFRLTPQIMGLMQPFGEVGIMKETMIHTLRALQGNYNILLATMDVFVKEPSVDWLEQAKKQAKKHGVAASELEENYVAFSKQKILFTRRKFVGGTNPREITLQELNARVIDEKSVLSKFKEVAAGDKKYNVRATLPAQGLSCEQQVSCLIDQATDYHILGKTWKGWEAWL